MTIDLKRSAEQITRRSSEMTEMNLSRGELLRYAAIGLEDIDPKAARAIRTIAIDIVQNCESILDDMNLLMDEVTRNQKPH